MHNNTAPGEVGISFRAMLAPCNLTRISLSDLRVMEPYLKYSKNCVLPLQ